MIYDGNKQGARPARAGLLATVAAAAFATCGAASFAQAQQAAQPAAGQTEAQAAIGQASQRLQQAEQTLQQAIQRLEGQPGAQRQQAAQAARQALEQVRQAMGQLPEAQRGEGYRNLERGVTEAEAAIQGERFEIGRARTTLREVLVAIPVLRTEADLMTAGPAVGGAIVVQQASPSIQVQQAEPRVTVMQPEPIITVVVPQPEIIVRQPPPQVTVEMPEPRVTVEQQQPQVRVAEAQPRIQVTPGQPQVQIQRGQPQVRVQQAEGQPQVRFEQQGQPVVTMQQQAQAPAGSEGLQQRSLTQEAPAVARQQAAVTTGTSATGAAPAQSGSPAQPVAAGVAAGVPLARVSNLVGTNVIGSNGRDAGQVENLLIDASGQVRAAVVEWGGFLGLGTRRAVVPMTNLRLGNEGERVTMELTREQLEQLPRYDQSRLGEYGQQQGWGEGTRLFR